MTDNAELKFDPDWPRGHVVLDTLGGRQVVYPARILAKLRNSKLPYVVLVSAPHQKGYAGPFDPLAGHEWIECFREGGFCESYDATPRLINAPVEAAP